MGHIQKLSRLILSCYLAQASMSQTPPSPKPRNHPTSILTCRLPHTTPYYQDHLHPIVGAAKQILALEPSRSSFQPWMTQIFCQAVPPFFTKLSPAHYNSSSPSSFLLAIFFPSSSTYLAPSLLTSILACCCLLTLFPLLASAVFQSLRLWHFTFPHLTTTPSSVPHSPRLCASQRPIPRCLLSTTQIASQSPVTVAMNMMVA